MAKTPYQRGLEDGKAGVPLDMDRFQFRPSQIGYIDGWRAGLALRQQESTTQGETDDQ